MGKTLCWIAVGGAVGALARFGVVQAAGRMGLAFPWGTLAVNVAGSFALGLLFGAFGRRESFALVAQPLVAVGALGAFTTFSAFALETVQFLQGERWLAGLAYVMASVALCVGAAWAGLHLAGAA